VKRLLLILSLMSLIALGSCLFVFDPWTKGSRIEGSLYYSNPAVGDNGKIYFYNSRGSLFELTPEGDINTVYSLESGELFSCGPSITDMGNIIVGTERSIQQNGFEIIFVGGLLKISPDGDLIWHFESNQAGSEASGGPSIGSDGKIYFGTRAGTLYCLDTNDGSKVWKVETGRAIRVKPAVASDGTVYFGTFSGETEKQIFYAVRDGSVLWTLESEGESTGFYSSPAIGTDGTVYTCCHDGYLYALDEEGTLLWSLEITSEQERAIASSPVISPNGTVYIGTQEGFIYAISSEEEGPEVLWTKDLDTRIPTTPLIADNNRIYVVGEHGATLFTLDETGAVLQKTQTGNSTMSSPVMSGEGTIYFGAILNDIGSRSIIYSLETYSVPAGPWPMFGRDAQRTSRAD